MLREAAGDEFFSIFVTFFFSVKGDLIRDTCETNLIKEDLRDVLLLGTHALQIGLVTFKINCT